jgi:hypothetical protein
MLSALQLKLKYSNFSANKNKKFLNFTTLKPAKLAIIILRIAKIIAFQIFPKALF